MPVTIHNSYIEYIGPLAEFSIVINGRVCTFAPNPAFGNRKVTLTHLANPEAYVRARRGVFAIYDPTSEANRNEAFFVNVFLRRKEVEAFLKSGKTPKEWLAPEEPEPVAEPVEEPVAEPKKGKKK